MPDLAPEAQAREQIDAQLTASGWTLQDYTRYDGSAASAIALREIPVKGGRCDYMLLIDRKPVGVIEAKKVERSCRWWRSSRLTTGPTSQTF